MRPLALRFGCGLLLLFLGLIPFRPRLQEHHATKRTAADAHAAVRVEFQRKRVQSRLRATAALAAAVLADEAHQTPPAKAEFGSGQIATTLCTNAAEQTVRSFLRRPVGPRRDWLAVRKSIAEEKVRSWHVGRSGPWLEGKHCMFYPAMHGLLRSSKLRLPAASPAALRFREHFEH